MKDNLGVINVILNAITFFGGLWITYVFYWIWRQEKRQIDLVRKLNELIDKLEKQRKIKNDAV